MVTDTYLDNLKIISFNMTRSQKKIHAKKKDCWISDCFNGGAIVNPIKVADCDGHTTLLGLVHCHSSDDNE